MWLEVFDENPFGTDCWLISADGVSKAYAGTGLRLGWMLVAPAVGARIRDLLSHAGAPSRARWLRS